MYAFVLKNPNEEGDSFWDDRNLMKFPTLRGLNLKKSDGRTENVSPVVANAVCFYFLFFLTEKCEGTVFFCFFRGVPVFDIEDHLDFV